MRTVRPRLSVLFALAPLAVVGAVQPAPAAPEVRTVSVSEQVVDDEPPIEINVVAPPYVETVPVGPAPVQIGPDLGGGVPVPSGPGTSVTPASPGIDLSLEDLLEIASTPPAGPPTAAEIGGRWHFEGVTGSGPAGFWFDFDDADEIGAGETEPLAGQGANDAAFAVPLPQADAAAWDGRTRGSYHYDPVTGYLDILQRGYVSPVTGRPYSLNIGLVVTKDPRDGGGIRAVSGLFTVWDITAGAAVGTGTLGISPPGSGKNILHY